MIIFSKNRVIAFSDAIFSIAITLLILEINIPNADIIQRQGTFGALAKLFPSFIGFVVSFLVTALYWISHLTFSRFIKAYDTQLLWLNIFLLFFVILLPFSTAFYVGSVALDGPFMWYCGNLVMLGFCNYLMIRKTVKNPVHPITSTTAKYLKFKSLNAVFVWLIALLITPFVPFIISRGLFVLLFIVEFLAKRYLSRKGDIVFPSQE